MRPAPPVSVLVPARDAVAFVGEAVISALQQDYPADRVEIVVVDDGSTDATAAVVEALALANPGRVRLIRQEHRGQVAAVNAAAAAATGELLALLDADDAWPADKLRRQVEVLQDRPEVGLVYGDLCVVDAEGEVLDPSWLAGERLPVGREVGRFLRHNLVVSSTILVRRALGAAILPIPDAMPWPDWWLAVRAAQVSEVAHLPHPRVRYRHHGANMSLGAQGAARLRELRKAIELQRWFLRRLTPGELDLQQLGLAWEGFELLSDEAAALAGTTREELFAVGDADRAHAALLLGGGDPATAVAAAATDPTSAAALAAVRAVLGARDPLAGARERVVLVDGEELLRAPALLPQCAERLRGEPTVTLAIDAGALEPGDAIPALTALVRDAGLDDDDALDLLVVAGPLDDPGRARLAAGTDVVCTLRPAPAAGGPPRVHPADLPDALAA